jgi:CCR4-NOT transcription complex subunit 3
MEARRAIEREMERFKAAEKEAKTKAFSKAALGATGKLDPREAALQAAREWITSTVDTLQEKGELLESEIEELGAALRKRQKPPPRLVLLQAVLGAHQRHITQLEKALRCLDNDAVHPDEIEALKDGMDFYLSECDEATGVPAGDGGGPSGGGGGGGNGEAPTLESVDDMYADIADRLEAVEAPAAAAGGTVGALPTHEGGVPSGGDSGAVAGAGGAGGSKSAKKGAKGGADKDGGGEVVSPQTSAGGGKAAGKQDKAGEESGKGTTPRRAGSDAAATTTAPLSPSGSGTVPRVSPVPAASPQYVPVPSRQQQQQQQQAQAAAAGGAGAAAGSDAPSAWQGGAVASGGSQAVASIVAAVAAGGKGAAASPGGAAAAPATAATTPPATPAAAAAAATPAGDADALAAALSATTLRGEGPGAAAARPAVAHGLQGLEALTRAAAAGLGFRVPPPSSPGAAAAAAAAATASPGGAPPVAVLPQVPPGVAPLALLDAAMRSAMPQPADADWSRPRPRHPAAAPPSYPRTPPEVISSPALFRRTDPEALFFAFYYQPATYQQYLAALELKRQSWRYHKAHGAWFQRYAEPTMTSEREERGSYVYFDYNILHDDLQAGWCYRRKEGFTFRYDALEDELGC